MSRFEAAHRQFAAADSICRALIVRMRIHEPAIAYGARRTAEGESNPDIIRCRKRSVRREGYRLIKTAREPKG